MKGFPVPPMIVTARVNPPSYMEVIAWLTFALLTLAPLLREEIQLYNTSIAMKALIAFPQILFSLCVFNCYRDDILARMDRWLILLVGAWLVWSTLSTVLADHFAAALVRQSEWLVHAIFAYAVFVFLRAQPDWGIRLVRVFCVGVIVHLAVILMFWHLLPDPQVYNWVSGTPGFSNIRHMGYYAMTMAALSLFLIASPAVSGNAFNRSTDLWLGLAAMTTAWFLLAWSGGRAPLIALAAAFAVLFLFRHSRLEGKLVSMVLVSALTGTLLSLFYAIPGQGIARFFARVADGTSVSAYSSGRIDIWRQVMDRIIENPMFGLGPDGYLFDGSRFSLTSVHPHNSSLQLMLEWGIPGMVLAAAIGVTVLLYLMFRRQIVSMASDAISGTLSARYFALLWAILSLLALSVVDGSLYHGQPLMLLAAVTGMSAAEKSVVRPPRGRSPVYLTIVLTGAASVMILHSLSLQVALRPPATAHFLMEVTTIFPSGLVDRRSKGPIDSYARARASTAPCSVQRLLQTAGKESRPREARYFTDLAQELGIRCQ